MAYITGTQALSSTPAKDYMELTLHPNLIANGFTYVEQYAPGATARVYKSAVASNGVADWYLVVFRGTDAATSVSFTVCESYNATTHLMIAYPPSVGTSVPDAANNYRFNDSTGILPTAGAGVARYTLSLSTSAFSYWLSVNSFRVCAANRVGSTDTSVYVGLCDNVVSTTVVPSSAVCLTVSPLADSSGTAGPSSGGAFTREPGQTASASQNWGACPRLFTFGFSFATADIYMAKNWSAQSATFSQRGTSSSPRGLLRGVVGYTPGGAVAGDTATLTDLSGTVKTYTCFGGAGAAFVDQAV